MLGDLRLSIVQGLVMLSVSVMFVVDMVHL